MAKFLLKYCTGLARIQDTSDHLFLRAVIDIFVPHRDILSESMVLSINIAESDTYCAPLVYATF